MAATDSLQWEQSKQVQNNLIVQFNSGSTEGTNKFTYNGSSAKTINIRPGTSISISDTTISHANVVTAGNAGPTANATISPGGSFVVPYIAYNAQGHITGRTNRTMTLSSELGNFEPVQKRTSYNPGDSFYMYKNGYSCFLHAAAEPASSLKSPLPSAYIPTAEVTLCGWCYNVSSNGLYPCIALINNRGIVVYISAMTTFGMKNQDIYYIYHADRATGSVFTDRRSNFTLWLTGAWNTSVNGA